MSYAAAILTFPLAMLRIPPVRLSLSKHLVGRGQR